MELSGLGLSAAQSSRPCSKLAAMDIELVLTIVNGVIIAAALVVFGVMLLRGALRERSLALGPERDLEQSPMMYLLGLAAVLGYCGSRAIVGESGGEKLQFVIELAPFVLIGLMIGRALRVDAGLRKLGLLPRHPERDTRWGVAGMFVGLGLAGGVGVVVNTISTRLGMPVPEVAHETLRNLRENFSIELLISVSIFAVIIAPVLEELVFRGLMQTCWVRLLGGMSWPAVVLTAGVFSLTHAWVVPWQGLVPLFVLGLVFGYLYERTGSLLTSTLAHAGFNAMNIAIAVLMPMQESMQ